MPKSFGRARKNEGENSSGAARRAHFRSIPVVLRLQYRRIHSCCGTLRASGFEFFRTYVYVPVSAKRSQTNCFSTSFERGAAATHNCSPIHPYCFLFWAVAPHIIFSATMCEDLAKDRRINSFSTFFVHGAANPHNCSSALFLCGAEAPKSIFQPNAFMCGAKAPHRNCSSTFFVHGTTALAKLSTLFLRGTAASHYTTTLFVTESKTPKSQCSSTFFARGAAAPRNCNHPHCFRMEPQRRPDVPLCSCAVPKPITHHYGI